MFIKRVDKPYPKTGKKYTEYRFVRSYRTSAGPRHQAVLTVWSIPLPEALWKQLADAIESILRNEEVLFVEAEVKALAEHYCTLIRARHPQVEPTREDTDRESETVDLVRRNSLSIHRDRSIGAEHIAHSMYRKLALDKLFRSLGFTQRQSDLAALSIIGRLVSPGSENATAYWARELSGIGELITDFRGLSHNSLYRISDLIFAHKEAIEQHLCAREREIFNLRESICLYDLTNTFIEGSGKGIPKAKHGRSKEKRTDCRLLTLGMVIDEQGFCKRSTILEGSVSEPGTLSEMIDYLSGHSYGTGKPTIVMDAGIATQENLQYLRSEGYHYICVARNDPFGLDEISSDNLVTVHIDKANRVEVQLLHKDDEVILYCHSQKMEKKERSMQDSFCRDFEADLEKIVTTLTRRYSDKSYGTIMQRIGRLRERYPAVSRFYQIEVKEQAGMVVAIDTHKVKAAEEELRYSGSYWLRTSHQAYTEQQLWDTYMLLSRIEAAFRSLKDELSFRPIHHSKGSRAEAHIFIAVLAYHLLNAIRHELQAAGLNYSWATIRRMMSTHRRVSISGITKEKTYFEDRVTTAPEPIHISIYKALNLSINPIKPPKSQGKM